MSTLIRINSEQKIIQSTPFYAELSQAGHSRKYKIPVKTKDTEITLKPGKLPSLIQYNTSCL